MTKNKIIGYAIGPVGSAVIGLITLPIITWFYSVEDVGRISMLQVVASFAVLLFCLGLDQAYVRAYYETENKPQLFKLTFFPGFILLGLVVLLAVLISPEYVSQLLFDIESALLGLVSLICFFLTFVIRFLSLILRMQERALAYSMSQLLSKVLFLFFILSIMWLGAKNNIYTLIAAHALSVFVVFIVFGWNTREEWSSSFLCEIDRELLKKHLTFGFPLIIGGLASWGLNVMDKLFLRGMSTFAELGVYSVAVSIAGVAMILSSVFNTIWAPMVFKWVSEKNEEEINKIDKISERLLAAIYFIVVLSGCFSWLLPLLLPVEYSSVQYLISACLIGPLFYTLSETTGIGITISRKTSFSMFASIGAMLVNACGNYILVPGMGATGAAISTAVAFWLFYILRTEFSRRVWRNIPSLKAYSVITLLLVAVVITAIAKASVVSVFVWATMLVFGTALFWSSLVFFISEAKRQI